MLLIDTVGTVHTYEQVIELVCGVNNCDQEPEEPTNEEVVEETEIADEEVEETNEDSSARSSIKSTPSSTVTRKAESKEE